MHSADNLELTAGQSRGIAARIREELARRRMSRQQLADAARISLSTLEKALSGRRPFTLATTIRLEQALALPLRDAAQASGHASGQAAGSLLAPGELGFYARPAVAFLEGVYLTLRPSFGEAGAIYAYRTEIAWDGALSSLVFRESERVDAEFAQQGLVSVPNQSGYIYLITNRQGQYRLVLVARPTISGEMFGIITTLQVGRGAQLMPVAAPIAYVPLANAAQRDGDFGRIAPEHRAFAAYRKYLRRAVEEPFALFLQV